MNETLNFNPIYASFFGKRNFKSVQVTERFICLFPQNNAPQTIDWIKVASVTFASKNITILCNNESVIKIPNQFAIELGQKLVQWSLFYDVPVFFDSSLKNPHAYTACIPTLEMV